MRKDTVLYLGNNCQRLGRLSGYLQSLGFDMRKAFSVSGAKQKLQEQLHDLVLIQFEPVRKQIFDFLSFVRHENREAVIIVLMAEARPNIESKLFDYGTDDVVAGRQTFPAVLTSRIKRRFYSSRLSMPTTTRIMLKGGALVDLGRGEIMLNGFSRKLEGVLYELFRYFLNSPHRAISREELIKSYIWDNSVCLPDKIESGRAVDMAIKRLRRLIEPDTSCPQIIIAVHGTGWILAKDAII